MSKTAGQLGLAALCGSLLIQMMAGCTAFSGKSKTVSNVRPVSYRMVAEPGPGASKMFYYAYLFPSIRMSKSGSPIEKMTPLRGAGGGLEGWRTASTRSAAMGHRVEKSFRRVGYDLISFPQLLARTQPYSVVVVSTFYTTPSPIKDPVEGGPDRTVTVKVKGVLFGLDLDPAKSLPVGTVLCTGFYSAEKDDVKEVTGKLLVEAARNLGEQFEGFGIL
ncbi:MAG: hypothetical protein KJO21_03750 [Verrucomicrobiae bacterium]|nr:hypothetical protein [Verrucomicrobiae bacterium]NNJ42613.1 hypothetical protein [Akkermansiaceae bacterium]